MPRKYRDTLIQYEISHQSWIMDRIEIKLDFCLPYIYLYNNRVILKSAPLRGVYNTFINYISYNYYIIF